MHPYLQATIISLYADVERKCFIIFGPIGQILVIFAQFMATFYFSKEITIKYFNSHFFKLKTVKKISKIQNFMSECAKNENLLSIFPWENHSLSRAHMLCK